VGGVPKFSVRLLRFAIQMSPPVSPPMPGRIDAK
jgi:hypothetical protein